MPLNRAVELQECEHEQADGNQAYGDWSSHECHLGLRQNQSAMARAKNNSVSVDTQSACSLTSLPVMMIKKDQQHTVGECMFCVGH